MDDTPLRYISEPDHPFIPIPTKFPQNNSESPKVPRKFLLLGGTIFLLLGFLVIHLHISAPAEFPTDTIVIVEKGQTLGGWARTLKDIKAIKSPFVFKIFTVLFAGGRGLTAGDYYLERSQNVITLAWRFSHSRYDLKNIRITIPEGFNSAEIAELFGKEKKFTHFDSKKFIALATPYEGYLFPDTYLFLPNITADDVINTMLSNYQKRIETLTSEIKLFGRPIRDVINMASIIEEEARTAETREIIAGILWKRFDQSMPLSVDSAFVLVNGKKKSSDLTLEDLKIDSPYNTYVNRGLPPTPISNPGLDAVRATIHPIATKYYFYLSDNQGDMHYAVTHDGHMANKEKYLR
ncbi:MAG TPA: endolytic transglycosylase MltG [Candidatus Paceibacterota bacterium]